MAINRDRLQRDHDAYIENTLDGGTDRRVNDQIAHGKLDTIAGALGVGDTTPSIFNVAATLASTEYSQALPANTKRFIIKARGKSKVQLAYTSGDTNVTYVTIPPGAVFEDTSFYSSQTIYFETNKAGETIEITAYS